MKNTTPRDRYNQLQKLLHEIAYGDRNKLIWWAVRGKGFTNKEVADVIGTKPQNINSIVRKIEKQTSVPVGTNPSYPPTMEDENN